jgi:hypothetical protein
MAKMMTCRSGNRSRTNDVMGLLAVLGGTFSRNSGHRPGHVLWPPPPSNPCFGLPRGRVHSCCVIVPGRGCNGPRENPILVRKTARLPSSTPMKANEAVP